MQRTASSPACELSSSTRRLPRILQQSLTWLSRQLQPSGSHASHARIRSIALLIDGENTSPEMIMPILTEAGKFGMITTRRVYGKASVLQSWQDTLTQYALRPVYQIPTSSTKNATDIALVIDAMDLLHTAQVDGFCLVASDSDYTPLVTRLREAGCLVVGMGKANTPMALVRACTFFVIIEQLTTPVGANQHTSPAPYGSQALPLAASAATPASTRRPAMLAPNGSPPAIHAAPPAAYKAALPDPAPLFLAVYDSLLATRGQVEFSTFVSECKRRYPDLVPTDYGYSRLASLIKSRIDLFRFEPGLLPGQKVVHRVEAPAAPAESVRPVEAPAAPAESARPVEAPAAPAESVRPVEAPATPAESARPVEASAAPAESARPVEAPAAPAESARPVEAPAAPAESARPVEASAAPAESVRPVETPAAPAESARPVEAPAAPTKSVRPVEAPAAAAKSVRPVEAPAAAAKSVRPVEAPAATSKGVRPVKAPAAMAEKARRLLLAAWDRAPKQDGWLFASVLGAHLKQLDPKFDPRTYGYERLGLLIQAYPDLFEIRERAKGGGYDIRLLSVRG